jgi:hypothetical protein
VAREDVDADGVVDMVRNDADAEADPVAAADRDAKDDADDDPVDSALTESLELALMEADDDEVPKDIVADDVPLEESDGIAEMVAPVSVGNDDDEPEEEGNAESVGSSDADDDEVAIADNDADVDAAADFEMEDDGDPDDEGCGLCDDDALVLALGLEARLSDTHAVVDPDADGKAVDEPLIVTIEAVAEPEWAAEAVTAEVTEKVSDCSLDIEMEDDAKPVRETDGDGETSGVNDSVGVSGADKDTVGKGEVESRVDRDGSREIVGVSDCEGDEESLGELDADRLGRVLREMLLDAGADAVPNGALAEAAADSRGEADAEVHTVLLGVAECVEEIEAVGVTLGDDDTRAERLTLTETSGERDVDTDTDAEWESVASDDGVSYTVAFCVVSADRVECMDGVIVRVGNEETLGLRDDDGERVSLKLDPVTLRDVRAVRVRDASLVSLRDMRGETDDVDETE